MTSMTAGRLKALSTTPGRHRIDDGLYLLVRDVVNSTWVFRYVAVGGKRRDMTIGPFDAISLPDARKQVQRWQAERKEGRDPIEIRKASIKSAASEAKAAVSLLAYAKEYHALRLPTWKTTSTPRSGCPL